LGFEPRVTFDGPVDTMVPDPLAEDVLATLREALSNATRHAKAGRVEIELTVTGTFVVLRVVDDGIGFAVDRVDTVAGHGLRNMRKRAERLGGRLDIGAGPDGGTMVEWQVAFLPLIARQAKGQLDRRQDVSAQERSE
jgi:signal transduction histidine kinase